MIDFDEFGLFVDVEIVLVIVVFVDFVDDIGFGFLHYWGCSIGFCLYWVYVVDDKFCLLIVE